ncbi:MAG: crosslink repair DNA glycosylase YcaQ family protein [Acidimicrobiia bacterium]
MRALSADRARRLALGAQGFTDPAPTGRVDVRHFRRVLQRVGLIQLDSVNVFSRTHYMPFFSRLGPYDREALDAWLWDSGEMFEYWAHAACLIPVEQHRLFRWRMEGGWHWGRVERMLVERPGFLEAVEAEVAAKGPLRTAHLDDPGERDAKAMWGWSDGKVALEALFLTGRVTTASRVNFVRYYDLTDRVISSDVLGMDTPGEDEARTEMLRIAARSLGVGTAADLADYHRLKVSRARPLLRQLVKAGELVDVEVEGWDDPAYMHAGAVVPRRVEGSALLSPFDSLVWSRPRVERIFDFHYRISIYEPSYRRVHGYYVLPYLVDDRLVGRVDLKADRDRGRLRVQGAFAEEGVDRPSVARRLGPDLESAAGWLGLNGVEVVDNGDLAGPLASLL